MYPAPIFDEFDELIFDVVAPDSLHMKIGLFNSIYDSVETDYPKINKWAEDLHILKDKLHKKFHGRDCSELLKHVDSLRERVLRDMIASSMRCRVIGKTWVFDALSSLIDATFYTVR